MKVLLVLVFALCVGAFANAQAAKTRHIKKTVTTTTTTTEEVAAPSDSATDVVTEAPAAVPADAPPVHHAYGNPSTNDTSLYFELAGRDIIYSLGIEKPLTSNQTVGLALSYLGVSGTDFDWSAFMANPYFTGYYGDRHRLFGTAGLLLMFANFSYHPTSVSLDPNGNAQTISGGIQRRSGNDVFPELGAGYEFRSNGGFIFRASLYFIYVHAYSDQSAKFMPLPGLTFGATL